MSHTEEQLKWFIIGGLTTFYKMHKVKSTKKEFKADVEYVLDLTKYHLKGGHIPTGTSNIWCYIVLDAARLFKMEEVIPVEKPVEKEDPKRTYYFCKQCVFCGKEYFRNKITEEQFENINENESIRFVYTDKGYNATIASTCENCVR